MKKSKILYWQHIPTTVPKNTTQVKKCIGIYSHPKKMFSIHTFRNVCTVVRKDEFLYQLVLRHELLFLKSSFIHPFSCWFSFKCYSFCFIWLNKLHLQLAPVVNILLLYWFSLFRIGFMSSCIKTTIFISNFFI